MKNFNNLSADKAGKTKNINMEIINNLLKKIYYQFNLPIPTFQQIGNKIYQLTVVALLTFGFQSFAQYVPPIGIPSPEFGINETVESIYGSGGYFTHYVDNTHANSSDDDNLNGSPSKPRKTIPRTLSAGSVVEVHGGPYLNSDTYVTLQMNGTESEPVFIRGVSNAARVMILGESTNSARTDFNFQGQYYIIENIDFYTKVRIVFDPSSKYGTLRNSEIHNPINSSGALNPTISASGEHTVIYNNEIHDNVRSVDKDVHGIQGSAGGDRIWVLNNKIYNNGGDGFQACHKCNVSPLGQPKNIYIGSNEFSGDKENGVDLKYATDVIISQNTFSNYKIDFDSGPACPIVIGSDGAPTRVWIIFNEIFDSKRSIRIEEVSDLWIVGNLIHDIETNAIALEKRGNLVRIINNTVYSADLFIDQFWRHEFSVNVYNNIIANMAGTIYGNYMNFESTQVYPVSDFQNNLFWQSGDDVLLRLGTGSSGPNESFNSAADFNAYPFGINNIINDPLFEDPTNNNFQLQNTPIPSPAINRGIESDVYQTFFDLYGIDIKVDYNGNSRPQGTGWDLGAYEYGSTLSNNDETLDTSISIIPNPTSDILTIDLDDGILKRVIIYNELGQYIKETTTEKINISNLSNGIYFVKITLQSGKEVTKKIVKN